MLLALVNKATQNGVLASVGVIPSALRNKVAAVISFFEPLEERLWKHQDAGTVCDAVSCLGYAYLLTDRPKKACEVLIDAVGRFPENGQLHRIALDAIMRANGEDAAFEFGRANVERMDTTGALIVAELSGQRGEYQVVESVRKALGAQALEHEAELRAFRILAYANAGKFSEIKEDLTDEKLAAESSVALLAIAAAVLHKEDRGSAERIVDRLLERIDSNSTLPEALAVAQVCRMLERHDDVVRLLESRLPTGYFSELHSRLFDALVQSGARRKALNMLQSFPVEAMSDGAVRSLAIELAQAANDWTELSRLSDLQLAAYPDRADAWVFRAVVYLRQRRFAELSRMLEREISLELKGGTQVQAQLSRFEIEFGPRERGFARLYRMFRLQPDNPEAASTYFGFIASLPEDQLPIAPPNVTPGSEVQLVDDHGTILTVVIDPALLSDMPSLQTFKSADGPVASALLGRASGDDVGIHDSLGGVHNYRIIRITSAFRTLAARARGLIPPMSVGAKGMVSLEVPTDADGHPDVSNLLAMLRERRQKVNETFAFYGQSPMSLGMLARLVGASTADLVSDWPRKDAPPLFVCQGNNEELISAYDLLQSGKGYVTDLATIQEMVLNDVEQALQICQPLYIAASAVETLADLKSMTEHDRSVGVAHEHDGCIVMTEASAEQRHLRQSHLNRLSETIERYCIVLPAYGTEEIPVNLARVRDTLDSDSLDVILLALEQSANLLTIDGKLRLLGAAAAELHGLWPQVIAAEALHREVIALDNYARFTMYSVLRRRTHIRIGGGDILWVFHQPAELRGAIQRALLVYLSDVTKDLRTCVTAVTELVKNAINQGVSGNALWSIIDYYYAPLLKRPDTDAKLLVVAVIWSLSAHVKRTLRPDRFPFASTSSDCESWIYTVTQAVLSAQTTAESMSKDAILNRVLNVYYQYPMTRPMLYSPRLGEPPDQAE